MSSFDWEYFLRQWSQAILDSMDDEERQLLPPEVVEASWLGYPGATADQIARAEARLKVKLPPSYREFLKVSNGWRQTARKSDSFNHRLWSTDDIERFAVRHPQWIRTFEDRQHTADASVDDDFPELDDQWEPVGIPDHEYFVYGEEQDPSKIRAEYLKTAIEISDVGLDSIYLLNPQVVTQEGEWEAWFLADYMAGAQCHSSADRYRSFRDMMEAEYLNYLEFREPDTEADQTFQMAEGLNTSLCDPVKEHRSNPASGSVELPSDLPTNRPHDPSSSAMAGPDLQGWQSLKQLTVELQGRQVANQAQYRTIAGAGELSQPQIWSGIAELQLHHWLRQRLAEAKQTPLAASPPVTGQLARSMSIATIPAIPVGAAIAHPSDREPPSAAPDPQPPAAQIPSSQPEAPPFAVNLEIDQLAIRQPFNPAVEVVVCPAVLQQAKVSRLCSLSSRHPFSIEVAFRLIGQQLERLPLQDVLYKTQGFAQSRTAHHWIDLGETPPSPLAEGCQTYTATLFTQTLEPGMYRLQMLTSLLGATQALTSFELPLLNVV